MESSRMVFVYDVCIRWRGAFIFIWGHLTIHCFQYCGHFIVGLILTGNTVGQRYNADNQHIEAETKRPPFNRRHFQTQFAFTDFFSSGSINSTPALDQIIIWTNDVLGCRRLYASLGLNEVTLLHPQMRRSGRRWCLAYEFDIWPILYPSHCCVVCDIVLY